MYKYFGVKKNYGFTLIELLVTIAIIGVLSSVVFGSLTIARTKAVNASIKSSLRQIASVVADTDNLDAGDENALTCGEIFTDPEVNKLIQFIDEKNQTDLGGPISYCSKSSSTYSFVIVSQKFKDPDNYFCVDSNFAVVEIPTSNVTASSEVRSCRTDSVVVVEEEEESSGAPAIVSLAYNTGSSVFDIGYNEEWTADSCPGMMLYDILDDGNIETASYYHPCNDYIPSGQTSASFSLNGFEDIGSGVPVSGDICVEGRHYTIEISGANMTGFTSGLTSTSMSATVLCQ